MQGTKVDALVLQEVLTTVDEKTTENTMDTLLDTTCTIQDDEGHQVPQGSLPSLRDIKTYMKKN